MSTGIKSDFLVISRGQWNKDASKEAIQASIDEFYLWLTRNIDEGRMKMGSRLANEGATVSKASIVNDGPSARARKSSEVTGGSSRAASMKPHKSRRRTLA